MTLSPENQNRAHHAVARGRQIRTGLWTIVSLSLAFVGVLVVSTIDTPAGDPLLESNAVAQMIATLGLVAAAVLPSLLGTRKDASVVREQVQNSHAKNQRDDMDDKHDVVVDMIGRFEERMNTRFETIDSSIDHVRRDVGRVADGHVTLDRRLRRHEHVLHGVQKTVDGLDKKFAPLEVDSETGEIHIIAPPTE